MGSERDSMAVPMLSGATAGIIARLMTHSVDTCKAKLQVQFGRVGQREAPFKTMTGAALHTLRNEGIAGLYRGIGISVVGALPAACAYFTIYETSKDRLSKLPLLEGYSSLAHLTAGFLAEAASCVFWVPIDVVKERLQVQSDLRSLKTYRGSVYTGSWHALQTVIKEEGIRGPYRGYGATLASFGPFSAMYFVFYEQCKLLAHQLHGSTLDADLPLPHVIAASASAGAAASFLTNPLDMVKLRMQVQRGSKGSLDFHYRHIVHGVTDLVKREGFLACFRGAGARIAFHAPSTALTLTMYERCKAFYTTILTPDT